MLSIDTWNESIVRFLVRDGYLECKGYAKDTQELQRKYIGSTKDIQWEYIGQTKEMGRRYRGNTKNMHRKYNIRNYYNLN